MIKNGKNIKVSELLEGFNCRAHLDLIGSLEVNGLSDNSGSVKSGDIFFAIKGQNNDGHNFAVEAVKKGAICVVIEKNIKEIAPSKKVYVKDTKKALALLANKYFGNPSKKMKIIGITGTNGKTTTSYLIEKALNKENQICGLVGTINYRLKNRVIKSTNTTPGNLQLLRMLKEMTGDGLSYVSMEVSSHALDQNRIRGIDFRTAVFTNITGDHLDYHKTFDDYLKSKLKLFENLSKDSFAIINYDDRYSEKFKASTKAKIILYGINKKSDIMAKDLNITIDKSSFILETPKGSINIESPLIGIYNIYNLLASASVLFTEGFELIGIKNGIEGLDSIEGRLEKVDIGQDFKVFIDFAHTHDAIFNVLSCLRPLTAGRLIIIFGCGGDRDKTKRPKMGKIASELSDYFVITNDNPRSEDPELIASDILKGIEKSPEKFEVILDRKTAIEKVLSGAESGDVIVIAGKGHENYQIFKDEVVEFSDRNIVKDFLKRKLEGISKINV